VTLNRPTAGASLLVNPRALIAGAREWAKQERKNAAGIGLSTPKPGEPRCKCHNCALLLQVDRYEAQLRRGGRKPRARATGCDH
jgi:hypothetical protein